MNKQTHVLFYWAIKKILRSNANFGILEGFLSELLGKDTEVLDMIERKRIRNSANNIFDRFDINVKDSSGELFLVEIEQIGVGALQCCNVKTFNVQRWFVPVSGFIYFPISHFCFFAFEFPQYFFYWLQISVIFSLKTVALIRWRLGDWKL
jgi:hypothetical protein